MTPTKSAVLLACACATAMSAASARDVARLSAGDAGCPADVAAARAEAGDDPPDVAHVRATKPATAPVQGKPTVRGNDATATGNRLQAPRWHSFLPGMFR